MAESEIKKNLKKILEKREEKAKKIHSLTEEFVQRKEDSIERLNQIAGKFLSLRPDERVSICNDEAVDCLVSLPEKIETLKESFDEAVKALTMLETRFSRHTVNLVVIGAMGAGKSKFLQSASGLSDECLPSYSGGSCTGVTSIVENSDVKTEAVFTFKTTQEVVDEMDREIRRFAWRLQAEDKLSIMKNFSDGVNNLNVLAGILEQEKKEIIGVDRIKRPVTDADKMEILSLLEIYDNHKAEWEPYLEDSEMGRMDSELKLRKTDEGREYVLEEKAKIEEYVSKHNASDTINYYKYVAVKKAVIRTRFSDSIDANIRLIDTVGIGDPAVDTERRMLEAINDQADGVIFLLEGGADRFQKQVIPKDRPLIEKFQEIYNSYRNKEDKDQKETKYWMAFLVNNRPMEGAAHDYGQRYLKSSIIPSFCGKGQIFGEHGIEFARAINVGEPSEVEEVLSEFLKQISDHLEDIDEGLEKFALKAMDHANAQDKALKDKLGSIHINLISNYKRNYMDKLRKKRINSLKEKLGKYGDEIRNGTGRETSKSFLQQSLDKVKLLKDEKNLPGFSFVFSKDMSLQGLIEYYNSSAAYQNDFQSARIAIFQALQGIIREIGSRPLDEQQKMERAFKKKIADLFVDELKLKLDSKKLADGLLGKLDTSDLHFFDKISEKLIDELEDTENIAKAFRSMDQFKLDKLNGITKALFSYFSAEYIKDTPYAERNVWLDEELETTEEGPENTKEKLLQELKEKLGSFIQAIEDKTRGETYLVDENEQMYEELVNFIHAMGPQHDAAWKGIFESMDDQNLLLENTAERERLVIVAAIAQDIDMQLHNI